MNNVTLVGRLVRSPELFIAENGQKGSFITLAVSRPYKNRDGEYETDFLDCSLWAGIAETTAQYCKTGDMIGINGKLQSRIIEYEDGTKFKKMEVVADRITFISSKDDDSGDNVSESGDNSHLVSNDMEENAHVNEQKNKKKKN